MEKFLKKFYAKLLTTLIVKCYYRIVNKQKKKKKRNDNYDENESMKEARMEELAFLLKNLNQAYFRNDEQIREWEEELQELENEYGKVDLNHLYIQPIFEEKTYKVYDLGILENEVLITFDECDLRRNILKFLGKNDYKMVLRLTQDYNNAWMEDDYNSMENICDYLEREFLGL